MGEDKAASGVEGHPLSGKWLVGIGTSCLMLCGASYLWGYWSYFNINFLEYISFQDVIARSVSGVVPIIVLVIVPLAWLYLPYLSHKVHALPKWHLILGNLLATPFAYPIGVLFLIVLWIYHDPNGALICLCPGVLAALSLGLLKWLRPSEYRQRAIGWSTTGLCLGILLLASFWWGRHQAYGRKQGKGPLHYVVIIENTQDLKEIIKDPVYIGQLGGFMFFASQTTPDTVGIPESRLSAVSIQKSEAEETKEMLSDARKTEK